MFPKRMSALKREEQDSSWWVDEQNGAEKMLGPTKATGHAKRGGEPGSTVVTSGSPGLGWERQERSLESHASQKSGPPQDGLCRGAWVLS